MTERKFNSYTLWLKWRYDGWRAAITCLNLPGRFAENPRSVLKKWVEHSYPSAWDRGDWKILPEGEKPKT